jgi:hypothetical protein
MITRFRPEGLGADETVPIGLISFGRAIGSCFGLWMRGFSFSDQWCCLAIPCLFAPRRLLN